MARFKESRRNAKEFPFQKANSYEGAQTVPYIGSTSSSADDVPVNDVSVIPQCIVSAIPQCAVSAIPQCTVSAIQQCIGRSQ